MLRIYKYRQYINSYKAFFQKASQSYLYFLKVFNLVTKYFINEFSLKITRVKSN